MSRSVMEQSNTKWLKRAGEMARAGQYLSTFLVLKVST